jgi:hypothetical protein
VAPKKAEPLRVVHSDSAEQCYWVEVSAPPKGCCAAQGPMWTTRTRLKDRPTCLRRAGSTAAHVGALPCAGHPVCGAGACGWTQAVCQGLRCGECGKNGITRVCDHALPISNHCVRAQQPMRWGEWLVNSAGMCASDYRGCARRQLLAGVFAQPVIVVCLGNRAHPADCRCVQKAGCRAVVHCARNGRPASWPPFLHEGWGFVPLICSGTHTLDVQPTTWLAGCAHAWLRQQLTCRWLWASLHAGSWHKKGTLSMQRHPWQVYIAKAD